MIQISRLIYFSIHEIQFFIQLQIFYNRRES